MNHHYPVYQLTNTNPFRRGVQRYGFNGKEDIDETNNQDYGMRAYASALCKFLTVDPLHSKYPELTPFQFASNTPIQAIDLDGLEAFFVHGTTNFDLAGENFNTGAYFFQRSHKIVQELPKLFGNSTINTDFRWSGDNANEARKVGGLELALYIIENRKEGEPITIVGHSHGGNIAIEAINFLVTNKLVSASDINLVALNTPDRNEQTLPANSPTNSFSINAHSDMIQELGSNAFDFENGILPDNFDKEIMFEDQNEGGPCDFSNHCPSDENFDEWYPDLTKAKQEHDDSKTKPGKK
jgi:RHS repeat-associated protein